jgi:hypothetical protein
MAGYPEWTAVRNRQGNGGFSGTDSEYIRGVSRIQMKQYPCHFGVEPVPDVDPDPATFVIDL